MGLSMEFSPFLEELENKEIGPIACLCAGNTSYYLGLAGITPAREWNR